MQNFENLVETQLESREIFDGHIMHVFKDTVRLPNGADASREYMRHVGAVCVVPLLDDGSVLLERQFRYPVGRVLIEIPAGKLDSRHYRVDVLQCPYVKYCELLGCKELTATFCLSDDRIYGTIV